MSRITAQEEAEVRRLGAEVASQFTQNPRFKFLGNAGLGRHGGALILAEASSEGREARKIVVKYSYGSLSPDEQSNADNDLRNEYMWLKRLRGAEHIGQLIDLAECSLLLPGTSNGESTYEESVRAAGGGSQQAPVRRCPTFALEYLSYGTLYQFEQRLYDFRWHGLPSRLLWRIWLCMVRQCVAMAFPPDIPDNEYVGQTIREGIIENQPYASIVQNSPHEHNFMFSVAADLPGDEHQPNLPVVKLIDFGRGRLDSEEVARRRLPDNPEEYASRKNLAAAAVAMIRLCSLTVVDRENYYLLERTAPYTWTDEAGTHTIFTIAPEILTANTVIDPTLRHLLVRTLAYPWASKPSLREVLAITEQAIARTRGDPGPMTEDARSLGIFESDDVIRGLVQHFLYDAA
ncbi:hypothetical protein F5X98DRAFT_377482 [Xylaria grammica]|nr:hypothetical protein F5X98DRAFT_377482 [Xylaria grammica]